MSMKKDWNDRAEKNPYHYVSSFRKDWDETSFFEWGEQQTKNAVDVFLKAQGFDPHDKVVLEIGCGPGRMTRALASRFSKVFAYDVSDKYIKMAIEKNSHLNNVNFYTNDGLTFPQVENESVDFAFSGWTMMHMPNKQVVEQNLREMARVLKKGGIYKIDPTIAEPNKLKGIARSKPFKPILSYFVIRDKLKITPTYEGVVFKEKEMLSILTALGLTANTLSEPEDGVLSENTLMRKWFYGKKN